MSVLVPAEVRRQLARPPAPAVFTEAELAGLPEAVRRHLQATIAPGTPLATSARLRMRGQLKLGRSFGGLTVPSAGRMGWFYGTDRWPEGEFFRFQLTALEPTAPSG